MFANEDNSDANPIAKPSSISHERSVSFSSIEIRQYPLCMGDNPGCLRGVPISMDWKHTEEISLGLDEYEECRGEPSETIAIPPHKRFEMLQRTKLYTRCEIMKTLQKVEADRERRKASSRDSEKEEYIEGLKRGILNKTLRRKKKQKERELLLPYLSPQNSVKKSGLRRSLSTSSTSCESTSLDDDHLSDVDNGEFERQLQIQT
ncbi:unnamed protein product [Cylindrotheca closterium]|uniref:Uncharacterized protein n=1 Tax=Cylindrotheca closterium TaxID=2856 RepID=A0AAD2JL09_9STRA|nr:unnamed protein product [Cylindrotheca closterium]